MEFWYGVLMFLIRTEFRWSLSLSSVILFHVHSLVLLLLPCLFKRVIVKFRKNWCLEVFVSQCYQDFKESLTSEMGKIVASSILVFVPYKAQVPCCYRISSGCFFQPNYQTSLSYLATIIFTLHSKTNHHLCQLCESIDKWLVWFSNESCPKNEVLLKDNFCWAIWKLDSTRWHVKEKIFILPLRAGCSCCQCIESSHGVLLHRLYL